MPLEFSTSDQRALTNGVKCLIYGDSGMGKTVMCATAPAPVLLSAESGELSLAPANIQRLYGVNTPGITYSIPIIIIKTVQDLEDALQFLIGPQGNQFQTVYIDSLTEIAEVVLNNAKRQVKDPRQAYGELIEKMQTVIRKYRDLPGKNVVMTAKMEPAKDELTGVVKYGPAMPGSKLGPQLPYYFDEVFRLAVNKTPQGESYRYLQTQPDIQYQAKDRSGALAVMEPPHLTSLFSKIIGV